MALHVLQSSKHQESTLQALILACFGLSMHCSCNCAKCQVLFSHTGPAWRLIRLLCSHSTLKRMTWKSRKIWWFCAFTEPEGPDRHFNGLDRVDTKARIPTPHSLHVAWTVVTSQDFEFARFLNFFQMFSWIYSWMIPGITSTVYLPWELMTGQEPSFRAFWFGVLSVMGSDQTKPIV